MEIKTKSGVVFLFDDKIGSLISHLCIFPCHKRGKAYAAFRVRIGKFSRNVYVHRAIISAPRGKYVDHINGDSQDNRLCNLRICSNIENTRNRTTLNKNNTSGFTGISWDRVNQKWTASIMVNRKNIKIGRYVRKDDAIAARIAASVKYFGDFAPQAYRLTNS